MLRGYSGQFCVSVDENGEDFNWKISNPETEETFEAGTAPTMAAALEAAYRALASAFRSEASSSLMTVEGQKPIKGGESNAT
ncbi:MAG TPA: hypothetical protein VNR51_08230 [Hyphomicrobium sp.]|nr:hypothetical protein [Hyphomicrobium sp.]